MSKEIAALLLTAAITAPAFAVPLLGQSPRHKRVAEKRMTATSKKPDSLKRTGTLLRLSDAGVEFLPEVKRLNVKGVVKPRRYCLKMDAAKVKALIKRGQQVQVTLQAGRGQLCLVDARVLPSYGR